VRGNGTLKVIALVLTAVAIFGAGAVAYASLVGTDANHEARIDGLEKDIPEIKRDVKELLRRLPPR